MEYKCIVKWYLEHAFVVAHVSSMNCTQMYVGAFTPVQLHLNTLCDCFSKAMADCCRSLSLSERFWSGLDGVQSTRCARIYF
jgi:hypothetical protein